MTDEELYLEASSPNNSPSTTWNLLDATLIALTTLIFIILGTSLLGFISRMVTRKVDIDPFDSFFYVASITAIEGLAIFASILVIGSLRRKLSASQLGLVRVNRYWLIIALLSTLLLIPLIGLIAVLIQYILGIPLNNPQLDVLVPTEFSWTGALATVIFGGVIVPFAEELFFRGILYQSIKNRFGIILGAILSSLIFGALHGEISVAGATFVMGLVLAFFYEKSKSIIPSILIHIANNSLKLIILYTMLALGLNIPT